MSLKRDPSDDYRYYGEDRKFRARRSGQVRFRLFHRGRREPLLILQLEEKHEIQKRQRVGTTWYPEPGMQWRDAILEDLSVMDITQLTIVRDGGEMPVCFRPFKSFWHGQKLVLQIMNGSVGSPHWTDAKMQDLLFKEGQILGGVGLITR